MIEARRALLAVLHDVQRHVIKVNTATAQHLLMSAITTRASPFSRLHHGDRRGRG